MEIQILNWLQSLHTPILDKIMQLITHLGDMGIIWIILTIVMLLIPKTRKSGVIMAAALIVDVILCNVILKKSDCESAAIRCQHSSTGISCKTERFFLFRPDTQQRRLPV